MPRAKQKLPKQEGAGAARVAAPPVTRKRAPRRKASQESEEATPEPSTTQAEKRKRHARTTSTASQPAEEAPAKRARAKPRAAPKPKPEKRAKPYLEEPPDGFLVRMQRLTLDRLFILGHTATGVDDNPVISFDIVGSTGNIYQTTIRKVPTCTCPDARFRKAQCKHICYALAHALRAPENLQYQPSFLSSELRDIWEASPIHKLDLASTENDDGRRKPIEGDCPICFMEFEPKEEIVWCQTSCGNNIHKNCFQKWAEQGGQNPVRCVYCRAEWNPKDSTRARKVESIRRGGIVGPLGYVNVAHQLPGRVIARDSSTSSPGSTSQQSPCSG